MLTADTFVAAKPNVRLAGTAAVIPAEGLIRTL